MKPAEPVPNASQKHTHKYHALVALFRVFRCADQLIVNLKKKDLKLRS